MINHAKLAVIWSKVSDPETLILCFTANYASGELAPSEETPEVKWCPEGEVFRRVSHPVNRDRINSLLQGHSNIQFHSYMTAPYRILS